MKTVFIEVERFFHKDVEIHLFQQMDLYILYFDPLIHLFHLNARDYFII